jgi:L-threonylcarbamoyladenylate synthase
VTRLPFTDREHAPEAARVAAEVVGRGGVVLLPTETFYGLGVDPRRRASVERLFAMKERPEGLAMPVLCGDWTQLERLVDVPERFRVRLSRIWPGPLTVVLRCRRRLPGTAGSTLAVRIPGHAMLRSVLYRTGPLTGTSANRHGRPPCCTPDTALESLACAPDLVLDGGPTAGGLPSTLIDLTGSEPVVLRVGAFDWDEPFGWQAPP